MKSHVEQLFDNYDRGSYPSPFEFREAFDADMAEREKARLAKDKISLSDFIAGLLFYFALLVIATSPAWLFAIEFLHERR